MREKFMDTTQSADVDRYLGFQSEAPAPEDYPLRRDSTQERFQFIREAAAKYQRTITTARQFNNYLASHFDKDGPVRRFIDKEVFFVAETNPHRNDLDEAVKLAKYVGLSPDEITKIALDKVCDQEKEELNSARSTTNLDQKKSEGYTEIATALIVASLVKFLEISGESLDTSLEPLSARIVEIVDASVSRESDAGSSGGLIKI